MPLPRMAKTSNAGRNCEMKVGDIICRKDIPQVQFRIIGTTPDWQGYWDVKPLKKYRGVGQMKKPMVAKDDERWVVLK